MTYLLDSNVLIEGRKGYYDFAICPGFWEWIETRHAAGAVLSVEKVRDEIGEGHDALVTWAARQPASFFAPVDAATQAAFGAVTHWAIHQHYQARAVGEFLQKADFFLVAHALAHSLTLVTHEREAATPSRIKIPNACRGPGISFTNPFQMLRNEGARFILP